MRWFKVNTEPPTVKGIIRHTNYKVTAINDPCVYCYGPSNTVEHILPKSLGGGGMYNQAKACRKCNCKRSSMPLLIWLLKIWRERESHDQGPQD